MKKTLKISPLLSLLNSYLIDSPQPVNISYLWNFGSKLRVCLVIQIITGITLAYILYLGKSFSFETNMQTLEYLPYFLSTIHLKLNNFKLKLKEYINSFDIIKGLRHASSFPLLPLKLVNYHNSLLGRMLRVLGGLSAFSLLTLNTEFALIENPNFFSYCLIAFLGLSHLFYMMTIFTVKFAYIIYHIVKGDWLHRNSPLKYLMTESSGALFCIKGICYASGIWFTAAGVSTGLDEIIGEDFFKEMAIIKKPALLLKSSVITFNESFYFGNYNFNSAMKENLNLNDNVTVADSNVLSKLKEQEQLIKLKSSITSKPEIKQVFDNLKKELNMDILKDLDAKLTEIKK